MTPPELRALLSDSLALWGVAATVSVADDGVAVLAPGGALLLRVRPAPPEERPARWWLARPGQERPCTSVLGLLRAVRNAVGAGATADARRLRVAIPPEP